MPSHVRSDFRIVLKVRDANGKTHTAGTYRADKRLVDWEAKMRVPHLHRVDPSGTWLGSLDGDRTELQVRRLGDGSFAKPIRVALPGLDGAIEQVRWLADGSGLAVTTTENLFLVAYRAGEAKAAKAIPVFHPIAHEQIRRIADTRMLPDGILVSTREPYPGEEELDFHAKHGAYFVRVADDVVQEVVDLTPKDGTVERASIRSEGRIVLLTERFDKDGGTSERHLVTMRTHDDRPPSVLDERLCTTEYCDVVNWTPGTQRLTYATAEGRVVLERPDRDGGKQDEATLFLDPDDDWGGNVHELWANAAHDRVLAANDKYLKVWDGEGNELWSWHPRRGDIKSAHFDGDEESVIVAVGNRVLRLKDGKAKRVVRERIRKRRPRKQRHDYDIPWEAHGFIDDVKPLPGGGLAYMVVQLDTREVGWEELEPPEGIPGGPEAKPKGS